MYWIISLHQNKWIQSFSSVHLDEESLSIKNRRNYQNKEGSRNIGTQGIYLCFSLSCDCNVIRTNYVVFG